MRWQYWVSNMDVNKLTILTNQLNLLTREITKNKKELEPNTLTAVTLGILREEEVENWVKELKLL